MSRNININAQFEVSASVSENFGGIYALLTRRRRGTVCSIVLAQVRQRSCVTSIAVITHERRAIPKRKFGSLIFLKGFRASKLSRISRGFTRRLATVFERLAAPDLTDVTQLTT